jgi:hypothetical protein
LAREVIIKKNVPTEGIDGITSSTDSRNLLSSDSPFIKMCCKKKCVTQEANREQLRRIRALCADAKQQNQLKTVCVQTITLHALPNTLQQRTQFQFANSLMCQSAFINAAGIKLRNFQKWRREASEGELARN